MSTVLRAHFADYAAFHQTKGNQACHYLGIPMIVLAIIGLFTAVPLGQVGGVSLTLAEPVILLITVYYLTLDAPLAVMMLLSSAVMAAGGRQIPIVASVGLFVVGWIFQFIGHYVYEHKSPAFFRNFVHLLVGPLWILAKATGRA